MIAVLFRFIENILVRLTILFLTFKVRMAVRLFAQVLSTAGLGLSFKAIKR